MTEKIPEALLRQFARFGALEQARRAVAEFPDILPELNRMAAEYTKANGNSFHASLGERVAAFAAATEPKKRGPGRPRKNGGPLGDEQQRTHVLDDERAARIGPKGRKKSHITRKGRRTLSLMMKRRWREAKKAEAAK